MVMDVVVGKEALKALAIEAERVALSRSEIMGVFYAQPIGGLQMPPKSPGLIYCISWPATRGADWRFSQARHTVPAQLLIETRNH